MRTGRWSRGGRLCVPQSSRVSSQVGSGEKGLGDRAEQRCRHVRGIGPSMPFMPWLDLMSEVTLQTDSRTRQSGVPSGAENDVILGFSLPRVRRLGPVKG